MSTLELILEAARRRGDADDPDHEVGDLQQLARDLWTLLTPQQRAEFHMRESLINWTDFVKEWNPEGELRQYLHDCEKCIFLGVHEWAEEGNPPKSIDLYVCLHDGIISTVIARHSSKGSDYSSGLGPAQAFKATQPTYPLVEALRRAEALGYSASPKCRRCKTEDLAYAGAVYCGAACAAKAEAGD